MEFSGTLKDVNLYENAIQDRPATALLFVSPSGDGSDGSTWDKAYTDFGLAMDACNTGANEHTVIAIAPTATYYDVNRSGDPTWSANVTLFGTHRRWSPIKNTHASATSVMKLTGKSALYHVAFSHDDIDGIILTDSAFRVREAGFNSSGSTGAVSAITIDGTGADIIGGIIDDVKIIGNATYTKGLAMTNCLISDFKNSSIHDCLEGIDILGANSGDCTFFTVDIGNCATGIKIEAGNSHHFQCIFLHNNTVNVNDVVYGHSWNNINGEFPETLYPLSRTGTTVTSGADTWGTAVTLRASGIATEPFKVIGFVLAPSAEEDMIIRLSADGGTTYFNTTIFATKKNKASGGGVSTDFVFNANTAITASLWGADTGKTADVSLKILKI